MIDPRGTVHPQQHLASFSGTLQADAYAGYAELYRDGRVREAACLAHARRKTAAYDGYHADGRVRGQTFAKALLSLAQQHGFVQTPTLLERFECGDYGERTFQLAKAAFADVPPAELNATLMAAGIRLDL